MGISQFVGSGENLFISGTQLFQSYVSSINGIQYSNIKITNIQ